MTILGASGKSHVKLFATQANPVPQVSLSTDYDFTAGTTGLFDTFTASESATASSSGALSPTASPPPFPVVTVSIAQEPGILTPQPQETFTSQQPIFEGTALPNQTVEIIIDSDQPIQDTITSDNFGRWQYRPDVPLDPGEHVLTIITRDALGVLQTINRSFTVYADGSQFTEPSVSPASGQTPTTPPTSTPTVPVTPVTIATPTLTATPTVTPTPTLTADQILLTQAMANLSLTPQAVTSGPTSPPVPHSGSFSLVIAGFAAVLSLGAGVLLFLL
jgi:hypothetical protein